MRNPHKIPRKAYCNGCDHTFDKMHELRNHRRSFRCGGRFLPVNERLQVTKLRLAREELSRELRAIKAVAGR